MPVIRWFTLKNTKTTILVMQIHVTVDVHKSDDDDKESDITEEETVRIENTSERELTPEPTFTEPIQANPKDIIKSEAKEIEDHEYEDIYSVKGRDSGSHSRSGSLSSASSHVVISDSPESGVSSPSPSELGKSESEENEKSKLEQRHSLPHQTQNNRTLKRVVSVPTNMCPPPPPPPPPEDIPSLPSTPASSPHISLAPVNSSPLPQREEERPPQQNSDGSGPQLGHLVNKQMVLPFIPPKFPSPLDPEGLIKPSEYLRSLQAAPPQDEPSPPAPPLPPPPPAQPLSTITIQDIASVQLRRTKAAKTMSCPPQSLAGTDTPFLAQKEDLIAELKMSKDISGIKKLKVERTKQEEKVGKEIATEISKQFSVDHFVEKMPDKDAAGNPIPPWKRQMLAKKAAEKARKEMEEQLAKEAEARRLQAIPAWKRHLLQKKSEQACQ
ncbi:unnamed protein product [Nezara viridula]|uniref:Espin n=1 Tax=Nezara viridula TaxID=85310 RepID=A0A9P0MTM3_NEZVI|nr:unnamed protein product [Nezara viridula]